MAEPFFYYESFENSEKPCIVRYGIDGGDPRIVAQVAVFYDSDLRELCALANKAQRNE